MPSKRGLSWPVDNPSPLFPFTKPGSKICWLYNWSPAPSFPPSSSSLPFIPMAWNDAHLPALRAFLSSSSPDQPGPPTTALAFNEPELPSQANMTVAHAVDAWMAGIEPLRKELGVRVGSPAISSSEDGVVWLSEFRDGIRRRGSDVDFWCLHWYGETLGQFYDYIWSTHHRLGPDKPVWITEFACTNWNGDAPLPREHVEAFARESVKYLDTLEWVERYCWFGPMKDVGTVGRWASMIDQDGRLTLLGREYRDE